MWEPQKMQNLGCVTIPLSCRFCNDSALLTISSLCLFCVILSLGLLARVYFCRVSFNFVSTNLTRTLAINVSIPNLSVAHLEQFQLPQLWKQRERPTDIGIDWTLSILTRNPHVVISRQRPFIANVAPKAMSFSCRVSANLHSVGWPLKPPPDHFWENYTKNLVEMFNCNWYSFCG